MDTPYPIERKQVNTNNQIRVQIFTYLLRRQDGSETQNQLSTTKFSTTNSAINVDTQVNRQQ